MTDDMMNLRTLVEKTPDADLLREMIDDFFALTPKDDPQAVARNALAALIFGAIGLPGVDFPE